MSEPRVIKKYPNRRLYDTTESRYITLHDVRQMVVERKSFVIIDKRTLEDITRTILLQVIAEQEQSARPLMSMDFLCDVIRCYSNQQLQVGHYLEETLRFFVERQRAQTP